MPALSAQVLANLFKVGMVVLFALVVLVLIQVQREVNRLRFLDWRLTVRSPNARRWPIHRKIFPGFRLIDVHRSIDALVAAHPGSEMLPYTAEVSLASLLIRRFKPSPRLERAPLKSYQVGPDTEIFAPTELFVLLADPQRRRRYNAVIRVHETDQGFVILEIATPIAASSEHLLAELTATAAAQSIFRNRTVRVVPGANTRSAYEEDSGTAPLDLAFVAEQPVTADAIIFEPGMQELLDRTVVDFHHRRAELVALGLPARRGVLFYGPPGTGKTFTCKYLIHRLQPVTTLVATGNALYQIAAICAIAQTLQPALVLLEDVDLVFTDRAQNSTPTLLGEFFDALDGFSSDDAVIFVLTTNALERVEGAIKDRPGRISQCLFFGPPSSPLRQRYLDTLLKPYSGSSINLARIVARTEGVSQAFLKELVFRAVQIASARAADERNHGAVHDDDLAQALTDMTIAAGPGGRRIIGFQAS